MATDSNTRSDSASQAPDAKTFRIALDKIMPGYKWTVHRAPKGSMKLVATGTQSSGFNRLSTLEVSWTRKDYDWFEARSAGYGLRAPWLGKSGDATLARALRGLQDYYRAKAATYSGHERALAAGRPTPTPEPHHD